MLPYYIGHYKKGSILIDKDDANEIINFKTAEEENEQSAKERSCLTLENRCKDCNIKITNEDYLEMRRICRLCSDNKTKERRNNENS